MEGLIVKILSEFADVEVVNSQGEKTIYVCKALGIFKHKNMKPLVGDIVEIRIENENDKIATIIKMFERRNELYRPTIANVDQVIIITAIKEPDFSPTLLNKYLAIVEYAQIKPVIVFTKKDLITVKDPIYRSYLNWYKKMKYEVHYISNKELDPEAWVRLVKIFKNKVSVLTGQTGAGKSATLNSLNDQLDIKTQEISKALGRGKHTTRHTQLYDVLGGKIADTPGFSSFEAKNLTKQALATSYHLFDELAQNCKFRGCIHLQEPICAIKQAIEDKKIPQFFYDDYVKILNQL